MSAKEEVFFSVDVETSGPIPGEFSMLTVGACLVDRPEITFACSLKPIVDRFDPAAMEVTGLSLADLARDGLEPSIAMTRFAEWIAQYAPEGSMPVLVGFNAPFDWSFVNYYFHRFTGGNPFGFSSLDIKAFYMGVTGCRWADTRSSEVSRRLEPRLSGDHDALHDAQYQAELFRLALALRGKL